MRSRRPALYRWLSVCVFAVAFAWIEAAVVFYLRTMVDRIDPYQPNPLPLVEGIVWVEIVREAATMILLLTVGLLAGRTWVSRLGYALVAFGVWDILYYLFLKLMTGWPRSLLDWDILFLIPLPWWGPILAPMLIALLMIVWGTLVTQFPQLQGVALAHRPVLALSVLGVLLALYVFMADAIRVAPGGEAALRELLPGSFPWPLFLVALGLMSAPIGQLLWVLVRARSGLSARTPGICS
ncbi:MAG: hypothetical protein MUE94_04135 [Verrucomicrobia bacterium]|jgi:hypothetical protein|nr:hypothetical protein [Verrucomicrobiota bacterium]